MSILPDAASPHPLWTTQAAPPAVSGFPHPRPEALCAAHLGQGQLLVQPHTDVAHVVEARPEQGQEQQHLRREPGESLARWLLLPPPGATTRPRSEGRAGGEAPLTTTTRVTRCSRKGA